jgi:hypothetical protein
MLDLTRQRSRKIALLAGLACLFCAPAQRILAQRTRPALDPLTESATSKTKLEVKEGSGDFEQWGNSLVISSAEKVTFRWRTDQEGVASAMWQVRDSPAFGQTSRINAGTILRSGEMNTVPAKGHVQPFEINTGQFAPQTPPQSPKRYYVYVVTRDAQGKAVGLQSAPVTITYLESSQNKPQLGSEYCHLSVARSYIFEHCALRFVEFSLIDPPNDRAQTYEPTSALQVLIKAPAAGRKFQIDCKFDSNGKQPYKAYGAGINQTTANDGGPTHVVFTYESKNTDWATFFFKTESAYLFFGCVVTNLK